MRNYFENYRLANVFYSSDTPTESLELDCGYCGCRVSPNCGYTIYSNNNRIGKLAYIYKCPHCQNPIIYFINDEETLPGIKYGREIRNLPANIQILYDECRTCYANNCYTSSQMIARTLLMHIAVEQGAEEGKNFLYYVNYLDEKGFIPPNGKKWVDFIRTTGNIANHEIVIKEKEETEKVITFLSMLLLFIYELPNMIEGETE